MEHWQLVARERIRDTLAHYNWTGDAFRLEDLAAAFCPDGILEIRDEPPIQGRRRIVQFLGGDVAGGDDEARRAAKRDEGVRRIVRHLLSNTRFVTLTPQRAKVESYFTVITEIGLDHCGRYRDTFVPADDGWLIEHRLVSVDWRSPNSTMAALDR